MAVAYTSLNPSGPPPFTDSAPDIGKGPDNAYRWIPGQYALSTIDLGGSDTLRIDATPDQIEVLANPTAEGKTWHWLFISIKNNPGLGHVYIDDYFSTSENGGHIENIVFSDGTVWHLADVMKVMKFAADVPVPVVHRDREKEREFGGNGDDILSGKRQKAQLKGNGGEDIFVFGKGEAGCGRNADTIHDFKKGEDKIDLSGIDANVHVGEDQAFTALLTRKQKFTEAGQLRYDAKKGILYGNTDSDKAAEFVIHLKNKPASLNLNDFII